MAKNSAGEMPFLDHLEELRWRIVWALGALIVGVIIGFTLVTRFQLIRILQEPIAPYLTSKLIYTHPADSFSITMNVAIAVGLVLASPVLLYQLWSFLSPALHRHEKKVVIPVIIGAVALFGAGVTMAYFFVMPMILKFLMTFQVESLQAMISATDYFSFVITMALIFGAAFELPVLILALAAMGLVTPKFLAKFRPYALVISFLGSAIITPGDIFLATLALCVPLYLLYEMSILLAMVIFRKRNAPAISHEPAAAEGAA